MSLFEKLYSQVKENINKHNREKLLKSECKKKIAEQEGLITKTEIEFQDSLTKDNRDFDSIVNKYEDLLYYKERLKLIRECYEEIFFNKETKK